MLSTAKRRDLAFSLFLLLLAVAFLWLCRTASPQPIRHFFGQAPFENPLDFLLLCAAVLCAMFLHEAGHLLASLLLQFEILGGVIGPLQIQILAEDVKVSWSWTTLFGASISAVPRSLDHWRPAMLAVICAGPAVTLATGIAAATGHPGGHPAAVFQIYFVQVSILLFVLGLIPSPRHARRHNDARLLFDLLRRNAGAEELELKVRLKLLVLNGVRPQDYPVVLLYCLANFRGRPEAEALFAQALSQWAIDAEEIELADAWDRRALALAQQCAAPLRNSALAASACFDVLFRDDPEAARSKFDQVDCDALFPTCFAHRARAARQIARGRPGRAPAHVLRAQYALPRGNTHFELERELLAKLHFLAMEKSSEQIAKFKTASA